MDLKAFFQQWLYQGGNIKLKGNWRYDTGRKKVYINIEQVQKNYKFTFLMEIGIYFQSKDKPQIQSMMIDKNVVSLEIDVAEKPDRLELDPETKLLATWDFTNQ